jgi:hypothetical protein
LRFGRPGGLTAGRYSSLVGVLLLKPPLVPGMAGSLPWSTAPRAPTSNDPNELLRRIDQNTTQIFHWVRAGVIVIIVLLLLVVVGF